VQAGFSTGVLVVKADAVLDEQLADCTAVYLSGGY